MPGRSSILSFAMCAALAAIAIVSAQDAKYPSLLRAAEIDIRVESAIACEVSMTLTAEGAVEVDHRIESFDGSRVELRTVEGAHQVGDPRTIGRTRSLVLRPFASTYRIRYRTVQPEHRDHRCPLWVPTVPTDGLSRPVRLEIELPPSTVPGRSMPAVTWAGRRGTGIFAHVPAFVRVPFVSAGERLGWDISRTMDAVTLALIAGATAFWVWRRTR